MCDGEYSSETTPIQISYNSVSVRLLTLHYDRFRRNWRITFAIAVTAAMANVSFGQNQPDSQLPKAAKSITVVAVEAMRMKAATSPELNAAEKKVVDELFKSAIGQLKVAEKTESQTVRLRKELADAASDLKTQQLLLAGKIDSTEPDTSKWPLATLQKRTSEAETALSTAQEQLRNVQAEVAKRTERRAQLPALQAATKQKTEAIAKSLKSPPPKDDSAAVAAAKRTLLQSQHQLYVTETDFLAQEALTYAGTARVWTAREDVARQNVMRTQDAAQFLKRELGERQKSDAEAQAHAARTAALIAHPAVKPDADRNSKLLDQNVALVSDVEKSRREYETADAEHKTLQRQFEAIRKRAEIAKFSRAIGQLLRTQKAKLPDTSKIRERIRDRQNTIANINLRILEWESERQESPDVDSLVKRALAGMPASTPKKERQEVADELKRVFTQRAQILADLIDNSGKRLDHLVALDTTERGLAESIDGHAKFIAEHILWVRSANPMGLRTVQQCWPNTWVLLSASHLRETWDALYADVTEQPVLPIALFCVLGWLFTRRGAFKTKIHDYGQDAKKRICTSMRPTMQTIFLTALISAPIPMLLVFVGWRLADGSSYDNFANSVGRTLLFVAGMHSVLEIVRRSCRAKGLGEAHFGWNSESAGAIRFCAHSLQLAFLPLIAIVALSEAWENDQVINTIGRLSFLASQIVLGLALFRLLRPSGPVMTAVVAQSMAKLVIATRRFWTAALIGGPFALAALSLLGYHYTAIQLALRLFSMFGLLAGLGALRAILLRWLVVTHRDVAIKRQRERIAAQVEADESSKQGETMVPNLVDAIPEVGLADIKQQTRDLIRIAMAVVVVAGTWLIWKDVLPALGVFNRFRLWPDGLTGTDGSPETWITLGDLLVAVVIAALTILAARNLPGFAEMTILKRLPLDAGARYAASSVTRYVIVTIGLVFSVRQIGIGWSSVQWLVAAMTVGLGFGLQEIFANFVSGMILLFERPIRVGDTVTVGDVTGTVTRIRIRATTVLDWDNKELIVPNKQFVTGNLVNWTLSNSHLRLVLNVGIAYGSDTRLATKLLYEIAQSNPHVLADPAPAVIFRQFGDSSLNMELRMFVGTVSHYRHLIHELNQAVDDEFKKHGIVVAFPQRDLHLHTVPESLSGARFQQAEDS